MIKAILTLVALASMIGLPAMAANPLFANDAPPLRMTLTGPFSTLAHGAKYSLQPYPATLALTDQPGAAQTLPIQVRARGITRRKYYCEFPPIYLLFDKATVKGSLFHGQRRLKLVAWCQASAGFGQRVRLEYLAYKLYNLITPMSFRVRAAEVTYRNSAADPGMTRFGYLIEDIRSVAGRNDRQELKGPSRMVSKPQLDARATARAAMFEYMISNLDWDFLANSAGEACCHNIRLLAAAGAQPATARNVVPVPYDFDLSGFVDAPYGLPPEGFHLERTTDRFYRGYCAMNGEVSAVAQEFLARRADMTALIEAEPQLTASVRDKTERFMDAFFDTLADPTRFQAQLIRHCR
jgi:hypothetical protein